MLDEDDCQRYGLHDYIVTYIHRHVIYLHNVACFSSDILAAAVRHDRADTGRQDQECPVDTRTAHRRQL